MCTTSTTTTPAAPLLRTPHLVLGPFYPLNPPDAHGEELWSHGGDDYGDTLRVELFGEVVDGLGACVAHALVEIWQADESGVYRHPASRQAAPRDAAFVGYGATRTDLQGRYRFGTRMPGSYGTAGGRRAPHIHFQVTSQRQRLVTQMFFPGEPSNSSDRWFQAVRDPRRLVANVVRQTPQLVELHWTIVLATP